MVENSQFDNSSNDMKKFKVLVKNPETNVVEKVNFVNPIVDEYEPSPKIPTQVEKPVKNIVPRKPTYSLLKGKKISEMLKEVVEPDSVDIKSIQIHDTLSPLIWEDDKVIKPDVRKALLLNAKRFIEFSNVENLRFEDIMLTGSLANFNYNENSDLDIHIVMDFSQISENEEFVSEFLKLKKQLWKENLPVQIKGHDVELYFQNTSEIHHASGTYSIIRNEWINKPIRKVININSSAIKLKSADFMNSIDDLATNQDKMGWLKNYEQLKDKIKRYRQSGLDKCGEYSIENLVFKILRNSGYLAKLIELKNEYLKNELTLNEYMS